MAIAFDKVDLYTQALNAAFINAQAGPEKPSPIDPALTIVPSGGLVENYPWLGPPPMLRKWEGFRQYSKLGATNYRVPNLTYTAEVEMLLENLEDDQIGGFKLQAAAMAKHVKEWPKIQTLQTLALGQTTKCFDDTNFFATSHTIGTGNNIVSAAAAASDGTTHAFVVLVTTNGVVKPLLWQNRQMEDFKTDAGSLDSSKTRMVRWWSDIRGAAAFGFWWDAILVKFANTPTVAEVQTALGTVNQRLRSFVYPKNRTSDPNMYVHQQMTCNTDTLLAVCSSGIEHIVRQALTLSLIAQTENFYKGFASLACSGYLDAVV